MSSSADLTVSISPECQIRQCRDLISALVQRRKALGMSQLALDYRAGLQDGYIGKLESWTHPTSGRKMGRVSMPLVLEALGVSLALITKDGEVLKPGSPDEAALSNLVPFYQRHVLFSD